VRAVAGISKIVLNSFNRVALARAVYARTKYVLLDDPLSAVVSAFNVTPPYFLKQEFSKGQSHFALPI
jgi:hypothetical protein